MPERAMALAKVPTRNAWSSMVLTSGISRLVLLGTLFALAGSTAPALKAAEADAPPLLAQATAAPVLTFPLKAVRKVEFANQGKMQTEITLSEKGRLSGYTRTWSDPGGTGFKAAVSVALTDLAGNVLFVSQTREYGVGGGGDSRGRSWSETLPAEVAPRVAGYVIYQVSPPDQLSRDWVKTAEGQRIVRQKYSAFQPHSK
jgi:hypothetical protein